MPGGPIALNLTNSAQVGQLLETVSGFFPAGQTISTAAFMAGTIDLLDANLCSLTLVRVEPRRKALVVVDNVTHNLNGDRYSHHKENLRNKRAWESDGVAQRLFTRVMRRPNIPFTYSATEWIRRFRWEDGFTAKVLSAAGWKANMSVVVPLDRRIFALLGVVRHDARPFNRRDARVLYCLGTIFHTRLIDIRGRRLRDELPASIRQTFDLLLSGVTEKEIARATEKNANTIHDQIKRLYAYFGVSSRAQLMARFIDVERLKNFEL